MSNYKSSIETIGKKSNNGDYDIIYYNANIVNADSSNDVNFNDVPNVKFQETRNVPIINNAGDYEFSIVRFQINGSNKMLPLFVPQIEIGQSDIDKTIYSIGLYLQKTFTDNNGDLKTFKGYASLPITFLSENLQYGDVANGLLPAPPLKTQDLSSDYYYVYTYEHVVTMVNATMKDVYDKLILDYNTYYVVNNGRPLGNQKFTSFPPYMTFESDKKLFSLYGDTYSYGGQFRRSYHEPNQNGDERFDLYFDDNLMGLFSSFDSVYYSNVITNNGSANNTELNHINFYNKLNTNIWKPNGYIGFTTLADSYYKMQQNYTSTSTLWSPVSSIVFTSNQLPVLVEQVSAPIIYGSSNDDNTNQSSTSSFSPIIADFVLNVKNADEYSQFILYDPQGEFKMASLMGGSNSAITNIDLACFWRNRLTGSLVPMKIYNYSSVSIKMMFRKKKI
jgi:hypothetical protein